LAGRLRCVGIVSAADGWHIAALRRAFASLGCDTVRVDPTRLWGAVAGPGDASGIRAGCSGVLEELDALVVRLVPPGSLDQIVFRIDALHLLADAGLPIVNTPRALERTIDKHWTSRLLLEAGVPTPRTVVAEQASEALRAFDAFGDVVVKPLLGSGGRGVFRISDRDHAWRAFRALEQQRSVLYVQEFVPHGRTDLRLFVAAGRVIAAARREGSGWKTNLAAGARAVPHRPSATEEELALRAAAAVGADYAGVDLLPCDDGRQLVTEVNGIPAWAGVEAATGVDIAAAIAGLVQARASAAATGGRRTR
jgi:RimK family alpha-L-glutamate ligase